MKSRRLAGSFLILFLSLLTGADAQLFDLDVSAGGEKMSGAAILGKTGDQWNEVKPPEGAGTPMVLLDSTGSAAAGIKFTQTDGTGFLDATNGDPSPAALEGDYLYNSNGNGLVETFSNLPAGSSFTLVIYGANNNVNEGDTFTLAGGTGNNSTTLNTTGASRNIAAGIGIAYNTFTGTVDATGTLTVTIMPGPGSTTAVFQGAQLKLTPPGAPAAGPSPTPAAKATSKAKR